MVIFNPISLNADLNISTNDCVNTINKMLAEGDFPYLFSLLVIQMASLDFRVLLNNARFVFIVACLLYYVLKKYFLPASIILKVIVFILIYIFSFAVWCIILSVSATGQ